MKQMVLAIIAGTLIAGGLLWYLLENSRDPATLDLVTDEIVADESEDNSTGALTPPAIDPETLTLSTTDSGLQYAQVAESENDTSPQPDSTVTVHYHGTLEDGSVFDSSYLSGQPLQFPLDQVIDGWQEGIPLMTVGSTYRFVIPPELAYGPAGGNHPLAGQTLTFDVELLDFQ